MSLYNMLRGTHPLHDLWLHLLDIEASDLRRYRDAWLREKDGKLQILVLTRCGGGNRRDYGYVFDEMQKHPEYIEDFDTDYDPTYAAFIFNLPDKFRSQVDPLLDDIRQTPGAIDAVIDNRSFREIFEEGMNAFTTTIETSSGKTTTSVISGADPKGTLN